LKGALRGLVVETQRRHFLVDQGAGDTLRCIAKGRDQSIACGDQVTYITERDGGGVIESVAERTSLFYRADEFKQKVVAANVTQVVCVIAPDPIYSPALLDRWLLAADAADVRAVIVVNKNDLSKTAPQVLATARETYTPLGYEVVATTAPDNIVSLREQLQGHKSVFIGQSGMGKSSLLNGLLGEDVRAVGPLSILRNAGTHTTTHSKLFALDAESWIIDSPGMQVFGVAHLSREQIAAALPEFRAVAGQCRFRNCLHHKEPDCAVHAALDAGIIRRSRFQTYLELSGGM
jgi:ribosome biogenesis GTPase / thiamine phosphate phosphatase